MKNMMVKLSAIVACIAFALQVNAQSEIIKEGDYTLDFSSQDPAFSKETKAAMIKTFFEVYPRLASKYNPQTSKYVTFRIDTAYNGVAATSNDRVVYSAKYMRNRPKDIDVVTHEVMHIVQAYGRGAGPGWLTEGIADYVRYTYGVDNAGAKWALPEYAADHHYTKSYRITARFLVWLDKHVREGIVTELDAALRSHTYTADIWKQLTNKTLDELWDTYSKSPVL